MYLATPVNLYSYSYFYQVLVPFLIAFTRRYMNTTILLRQRRLRLLEVQLLFAGAEYWYLYNNTLRATREITERSQEVKFTYLRSDVFPTGTDHPPEPNH